MNFYFDLDKEISDFESWARRIPGIRTRRVGYDFKDNITQKMWMAWEPRARMFERQQESEHE